MPPSPPTIAIELHDDNSTVLDGDSQDYYPDDSSWERIIEDSGLCQSRYSGTSHSHWLISSLPPTVTQHFPLDELTGFDSGERDIMDASESELFLRPRPRFSYSCRWHADPFLDKPNGQLKRIQSPIKDDRNQRLDGSDSTVPLAGAQPLERLSSVSVCKVLSLAYLS
jgi:hypothetical protein